MAHQDVTMDLFLVLDRAQAVDGRKRQTGRIAVEQHDTQVRALMGL